MWKERHVKQKPADGGERSNVRPHHSMVLVLVVVAVARGQRGSGLLLISNLITGEKLAELLNTETQKETRRKKIHDGSDDRPDGRKLGRVNDFLSLQMNAGSI